MVTTQSSNGASALSARSLVNSKKLTKAARAILSAEILAGECALKPTVKLVAAALGTSVAYVQAAKKLTPNQRQAVRTGLRPLIVPHAAPAMPVPTAPPVSVERLLASIVDKIGVNGVLDLLAVSEKAAA